MKTDRRAPAGREPSRGSKPPSNPAVSLHEGSGRDRFRSAAGLGVLAPAAGGGAFAAAEFAFLAWLARQVRESRRGSAAQPRTRAARARRSRDLASAIRSISRGRCSRANGLDPRGARPREPGGRAVAHLQAAVGAGHSGRRAGLRGGAADASSEPGATRCAWRPPRATAMRCACSPRTTARWASCQSISQKPRRTRAVGTGEKLRTARTRLRSCASNSGFGLLGVRALSNRLLHEQVLDRDQDHRDREADQRAFHGRVHVRFTLA